MSFLNPSLPASEYADIACHNLTMTGLATGVFSPTPKAYLGIYNLAAQTILPEQPIVFDTFTVNKGVSVVPGTFAPFTSPGTIFTLLAIGVYQITYSVTCAGDGSVVLYLSPNTISNAVRFIPSTSAKQSTGNLATDISPITRTILITTTATSQQFAICNADAFASLVIPVTVNSNSNPTSLTILQIL